MFKSIGTWMACAAMLSTGLMAQEEAPKANPIEVKEQNGEVLGSLGQTDNKWIPSVNINAGFQTKFFNRGLMLDKNPHASIDVSFSWMPTENSRLSIGINGSAPTRNSHKYIQVAKLNKGQQLIDENGDPVAFGYYDDYLEWFGEKWNQNVLDITSFRDYSYIFQKNVPIYQQDLTFEKISYTQLREKNEFDERQIKLEYTYTIKDVPFVGDFSITAGFTALRDNDIYSKLEQLTEYNDYSLLVAREAYEIPKALNPILSQTIYPPITQLITSIINQNPQVVTYYYKQKAEEYYPHAKYPLTEAAYIYLGGLIALKEICEENPDDNADLVELLNYIENCISLWKDAADEINKTDGYKINRYYTRKYRDQRREELNIGLSLDNVLDSTSMILNPNMSFNFVTNGHVWMQYGLNFTMPLEIISNKLTWDSSVDAYWFDHDYFKVSECTSFFVVDKDGKLDQARTEELLQIDSSYHGTKEVAHSPSGFKTFTARTSLNYAIRPNIIISPNVSVVHRIDILDHSVDNKRLFDQNDFVWCGINLNYSF